MDEDGWFHTGDVGELQPNLGLKIIDRKKNIFKLSQGEYIAPEKLEQAYMKSNYIAQIFVYGDSLNSFLVAVVFPDKEYICANDDVDEADYDEHIQTSLFSETILDEIKTIKEERGVSHITHSSMDLKFLRKSHV